MSRLASNRWTTPADVKARLRRRWERGEILGDPLADTSIFPLRIPIKGPSSGEISRDFSAARDWIATWRTQRGMNCEWKSFVHRLFGNNEMPVAVVFPDVPPVVRLLGVQAEWETFQSVVDQTRASFPELLPWLGKRTMSALAISPDWKALLTVVGWIREHPRSGVYLRQMDAPGVHTKLIERHRGTLTELLNLVLPTEFICDDERGVSAFNRRYGFCDKPDRIRLRFLDERCAIEPERLGMDLTITDSAFATLKPKIDRVFITENEINFLAFPRQAASLVIFGSGYGWSSLAKADWLRHCEIHYWGDIDSHGFAILDQLRSHFPHVRSFLMNLETLSHLHELCSIEPDPHRSELWRLTDDENATLDRLRNGLNSTSLRLEQERIPFAMLQKALDRIAGESANFVKSGVFSDATRNASDPV